jgi:hypothetical protein
MSTEIQRLRQLSPVRDGLKIAQDAVLGWLIRDESVPTGTAEFTSPFSAVPAGLLQRVPSTQDYVLGYFQSVPTGLHEAPPQSAKPAAASNGSRTG